MNVRTDHEPAGITLLLMRAYQRLLQGLAWVLPFPQPRKLIGAGALRSLPPLMRGRRWRRPLLVTNEQLLKLQLPQPLLAEPDQIGRAHV